MTGNKTRKLCLVISCLCIFTSALLAEEVKYFEGFEGKENPVSQMAFGPNDKYKVNFAGLTTEKSRSGKQSYKLDITQLAFR